MIQWFIFERGLSYNKMSWLYHIISLQSCTIIQLVLYDIFLFLISVMKYTLETYLTLKTNFGLENYFSVTRNFHQRKAFCKLRISSHKLFIETGRYTKIDRQNRICKNYNCNEIESEFHFFKSNKIKYFIDNKPYAGVYQYNHMTLNNT